MNTQYSCSEKDNWMLAIHAIQGLIEQSIRACFHIKLSLVLKYKRVRRVNNWKMEILRLSLGFMSVREIIVLHHCLELVLWRPRRVQPLWQICKHLYRLINLGFFFQHSYKQPQFIQYKCVCVQVFTIRKSIQTCDAVAIRYEKSFSAISLLFAENVSFLGTKR